jgi:hypothetical protein
MLEPTSINGVPWRKQFDDAEDLSDWAKGLVEALLYAEGEIKLKAQQLPDFGVVAYFRSPNKEVHLGEEGVTEGEDELGYDFDLDREAPKTRSEAEDLVRKWSEMYPNVEFRVESR